MLSEPARATAMTPRRPALTSLRVACLVLAMAAGAVAFAQAPPPGQGRPPPPRGMRPPPPPPGQPPPAPPPSETREPAPAPTEAAAPAIPRSSPALQVAPERESPALASLATARESGRDDELGAALLAAAADHERRGDPASALPLLEEAATLAHRIDDHRLGREAATAAAGIHQRLGDRPQEQAWRDQAEIHRQHIAGQFPAASRPGSGDDRTPSASAAPDSPPTREPAPPARSRWPWLFALLALLPLWAWLRNLRDTHRLTQEAERLERHQRQLRTANSALQEQAERLRQAVVQDALTGTLSRNAFARQLEEVLLHAGHYGKPVALMVFDLDHFKDINDGHGHLAGDAALKLVAGIVRENLRSDDLFGRFGGDEFLIGCADLGRDEALALAEKIRIAVQQRAGAERPELARLSLSIGIAHADPGTGYRSELLFSRADAALYAAKRGGRNRSVLEDTATPAPPRDRHAPRSLASASGGA